MYVIAIARDNSPFTDLNIMLFYTRHLDGKHSSKVEMEGDVSSPEEAEAFGVKVAQELVSKGADLILRTQAR